MSVLSPTVTHIAILNHSSTERERFNDKSVWDVNAREQVMRWQFESRVRYAAFSPTDSVFAAPFKARISFVELANWGVHWNDGAHKFSSQACSTF